MALFWTRGWVDTKGTHATNVTAGQDLLQWTLVKETAPDSHIFIEALNEEEAQGWVYSIRGGLAGEKIDIILYEEFHKDISGNVTPGGLHIDRGCPEITDDATLGYVVGTQWYSTSRKALWVSLDDTPGAAVWQEVSNFRSSLLAPTVNDDYSACYFPGYIWFSTAGILYTCIDATNGAAIWMPIAGGSGGSNVISVNYDTATQILTVITDQPATFTTIIPLSTVTDNGNGTFTFDNQVDPPVTWAQGTGIVVTIQEGQNVDIDSTDPANPIVNACTEDVQFTGVLTPPPFLVQQSDYTTPGLDTASTLRLEAVGGPRELSGIIPGATPTDTHGRILIIHNVGTEDITIPHNSSNSSFANRFLMFDGRTLTVAPNQMVICQYDDEPSVLKWRCITQPRTDRLIILTYAQLVTLVSIDAIIAGQLYWVTDAADTDQGLIVMGTEQNHMDESATAWYFDPDYQNVGSYSAVSGFAGNVGVWSAAGEAGYVPNNVVIWNGYHYKMTFNILLDGTPPDVNTNGYMLLPRNFSNGYIQVWDTVSWDYDHNWIVWREDRRGNKIGGSWNYEQITANGFNVITQFQWGNNNNSGNQCQDARIDCLNSYLAIRNNDVRNYSAINANTTGNTINTNVLDNGSTLNALLNSNVISQNRLYNGSILADNNQGNIIGNNIDFSVLQAERNLGFIFSNHIDSSTFIASDNQGSISHNEIDNAIQFDCANFTGTMSQCKVRSQGSFNANSSSSAFENIVIETSGNLDANASTSPTLRNIFVGRDSVADLSTAIASVSNIVVDNSSNFGAASVNGVIDDLLIDTGSVVDATNMNGSMKWNRVMNHSVLDISAQSFGAFFESNLIDSGAQVVAGNAGIIRGCVFEQGCIPDVSRNSGFSLINCRISGGFTVTIDPITTYNNEIMERGNNTFQTTLNISGVSAINMTALEFAGVVLLTSTNATEGINSITNNVDTWPIKFIPEDGLAVTWVHTAIGGLGADDIALENDTDVTTVGRATISDYIVIARENTSYNRQVTGSII